MSSTILAKRVWHTLSKSVELSIDNIHVKQGLTTKCLGIVVDVVLTWHNQIDKATRKIALPLVP